VARTESTKRSDLLVVVAPFSQARAHLDRMAPECTGTDYVTRAEGSVGVRYRVGSMAPAVTTVGGVQAFLLGHVVSERPVPDGPVEHIVRMLQTGDRTGMARMQGVFALVCVDWKAGRVWVVSDLLGVRPLYWTHQGRVTAIADRALTAARLGDVRIAPRAMATWMVFKHTLGEDSLFEGVRHVPPASVGDFDGGNGRWRSYWKPVSAEEPVDEAELWAGVYDDFRASVVRLLKPHKSAAILLSGGFDSRLVLLTARRHTQTELHLATVPYNDGERRVVGQLVRLTGLPCTRLEVHGSILDAFDTLWHAHPDGYVLMRNLTHLPVMKRGEPGPYLDGWMGSGLFRPPSLPPDLGRPSNAEAIDLVWRSHAGRTADFLLRDSVRSHVADLAREALARQLALLGDTSKPCLLWDVTVWQGRYISNGFIQWQHVAESLHPFFDRALIERRLRHRHAAFSRDAYRRLLAERFPPAGALPHATHMGTGHDVHAAYCWRLQRALPFLARFVARENRLLRARWVLPRLSAYAIGRRRQKYVVEEVARMHALWRHLRGEGIDFTYADVFAR